MSHDEVLVPRERLHKLVEWMQRTQEELTCSDLCDKTYEQQGCIGHCALEDGKKELEWWDNALTAKEPL